jgi:hypothetical protein
MNGACTLQAHSTHTPSTLQAHSKHTPITLHALTACSRELWFHLPVIKFMAFEAMLSKILHILPLCLPTCSNSTILCYLPARSRNFTMPPWHLGSAVLHAPGSQNTQHCNTLSFLSRSQCLAYHWWHNSPPSPHHWVLLQICLQVRNPDCDIH